MYGVGCKVSSLAEQSTAKSLTLIVRLTQWSQLLARRVRWAWVTTVALGIDGSISLGIGSPLTLKLQCRTVGQCPCNR
jgi:hypothetical protein